MILLQYFHAEETLHVNGHTYRATCRVRNEINNKRNVDEIRYTYPLDGLRKPYYPRKFPTVVWQVKKPIWTTDQEYAPVKIPTSAKRTVLIWDIALKEYKCVTEETQEDAFYHLHFAKNSRTTLGCIRLNSAEDAKKIAELVEWYLKNNQKVYIEVFGSKE